MYPNNITHGINGLHPQYWRVLSVLSELLNIIIVGYCIPIFSGIQKVKICVWKLSLMDWRTDRRQETGWELSGDMWKVSNHEIVTMAVSGGGRYSRYNYRNKVWIFPLIFDTELVSNEQWMWCCVLRYYLVTRSHVSLSFTQTHENRPPMHFKFPL